MPHDAADADRLVIDLDGDTARALRVRARREGLTVEDELRRLVVRGLNEATDSTLPSGDDLMRGFERFREGATTVSLDDLRRLRPED